MAAPTSVRCEATSSTTTRVYWVANGSADVGIYRSPDGITYALVATNVVSNSPYIDSGLSSGTRYWYKLSDDVGVSFSSVVTVVTHTCPDLGVTSGLQLPRFEDEAQQVANLNEMARRIEEFTEGRVISPGDCLLCPVNGAIIVDCSGGCNNFVVLVDTDINSITMNVCEFTEANIEFLIAPDTTFGICGWPAGLGFSGDECTDGPIAGGTLGRSIGATIGGPGARGLRVTQGGSQPGHASGGGGAGGCSCVPTSGALKIQCCSTDCSMNCATTRRLDLTACGGKPPYSWTTTKGTLLSTHGSSVTVAASNNNVAGVASRVLIGGDDGVCTGGADYTRKEYGCNDQLVSSTVVSWSSPCCECSTGVPSPTSCSEPPNAGCGAGVVSFRCSTFTCDLRDAGMIAAGCVPCFSLIGGVVTVTDSLGTAVSKTLAG